MTESYFQFVHRLRIIHFLCDEYNFKIMKLLLEQTEGISIYQVSKKTGIQKSLVKYRLQKFANMGLCSVNLDVPKYEHQKQTKVYKLMYLLKPYGRKIGSKFTDVMEVEVLPMMEKV